MATPTQKRLVQKRLTDIHEAKNTTWSRRFKWTGFSSKTLWQWLKLLFQAIGAVAIPLSIIVGVSQFNAQQSESGKMLATQVAASAAQALDQQQETTLDTYLDRMSDLLIMHNLRGSKPGDTVRALAEARTLIAIRNLDLDPRRRGILIKFLWKAYLINGPQPIIDLRTAYLKKVDLSSAILDNINLGGALLDQASFFYSNLPRSDLSGASLTYANLQGIELIDANLHDARLQGADLSCANVQGPQGLYFSCSDLRGANLTSANLSHTNLRHAYLQGANLQGADLDGAYLQGARYNTKTIQGKDAQGNPLTLEPTQWPQGFDPVNEGLICVDC